MTGRYQRPRAGAKVLKLRELGRDGWQTTVVETAELSGWKCWHDNDSRRNRAGLPDQIMVRAPRVLFVELKTDDGRLTAEQSEWAAELLRCPGVEYYVWRPRDWTQVLAVLR